MIAIVMATLLLLGVACYLRAYEQNEQMPALAVMNEAQVGLDPRLIGLAVQELVVPLAMIYLLSGTRLFQRFVTAQEQPGDEFNLFLALGTCQLLFFAYSWGLDQWEGIVTFGVFVLAVGGLLGGWRVGVGLGLLTMFLQGSKTLVFEYINEYELLVEAGFPFGDILLWDYLLNLEAISALWVGMVAAGYRELLGQRRLILRWAFSLGIFLELVPTLLIILVSLDVELIERLLPATLVSGLSLVAFALIVRNIEGQAAQRQAERAELALAQAELRALRAQINPHFLFNSLNTILYFIRTDPNTAYDLLVDLSDIFHNVLNAGELVPLADEVRYVQAYLALEQARLEERLEVVWEMPDEIPIPWQVPTLILQPIIENAVIHGIAKKPEGGRVKITVQATQGDLLLRVEDSGVGFPALPLVSHHQAEYQTTNTVNRRLTSGIGLQNVSNRLRTLYGAEYQLEIASEPGVGTSVQIRIPL